MQELSAGDRIVTVGELFDLYMENHAKLHCRRWGDARDVFERHLRRWELRDSASVRRFDVQQLHADLGANRGKTIANRVVQLLKTVYNRGIEWDIIPNVNPARGVRMFRLKSRERFLGTEELERWSDAVGRLRYRTTRDYLWLCLLTGARRRNVAAMAWRDISFENATWTIPETKNGDSQAVPLTALAVDILDRRRRITDGSLFVFASTRSQSGHLTSPERAWEVVKCDSGLTDIRMHDLRRTLASHMCMSGSNLFVVAKMLGHRDLKSVEPYGRLHIEPVREGMESAQSRMRLR